MSKTIRQTGFIFLGILSTWSAIALAEPLSINPVADRIALDEAHKKEFLNLNFFYDGLGMHVSPELVDLVQLPKPVLEYLGGDKAIHDKFGLNVDEKTGRPVGLFKEKYQGINVGAVGCVACHSGKAAGRFYIGLGNKNIDIAAIAKSALFVENLWKHAKPESEKSAAYKKVEDSALTFVTHLTDEAHVNLTQGLVPTAMIRRWFYSNAGEEIPAGMPRAAVKVPVFYGYGEKKKVGQFCDGGGDGNYPGWAIAVELAAGQDPTNVHQFIPKIQHAEDILSDFLPPAYPFIIDTVRAQRGKATFENTCAHCHGTYEWDANGFPIFKAPKLVPLSVVKTDGDREAMLDEHFIDLVRKNPLNDIIREANDRNQYFAPRLHAVWARFPYLHNGSVPSVRALLTPPENRPQVFDLHDVGEEYRYDQKNFGMTLPAANSPEAQKLLQDGRNGVRSVYWVGRVGQSNQGHNFFTDLKDTDKDDLIEYLKTL